MSCGVKVYSPKTGEYIDSKLWSSINAEVLDEKFADLLFSKTRSENFKAWFGDVYNPNESSSKVVDENGEPLLLFHSSTKKFEEFNKKFSQELGFHFGTEQSALERHSPWVIGEGVESNISEKELLRNARTDLKDEIEDFSMYPVFLNIRNMIEGVDYLSAERNEKMNQDEYDFLYNLGKKSFSTEFIQLTIAFHQKGSITRDQAIDILSGKDKNKLRKHLGNPDGYWYVNELENKGAISYVVFDPQNIKSLYNIGEYSPEENIFYNLAEDNKVDFTLKVINALQKTPRKKYPSNDIQGFYNDLVKQGAPKNQIELLKNYILTNNIQEIDVQDLITGLASEISYTIEINTAKTSRDLEDTPTATTVYRNFEFEGNQFTKNDELDFDGEYKEVYRRDGKQIKRAEFIEFAKKAEQVRSATPTQYYSNLIVPGGTNYTENEIATPAITPSIKGHAQFSTDNGIGWFRSDDKENKVVGWKEEDDFLNSETAQYNPITKDDKIIFGHPTIGKSYLKQKGNNDFITLDDDYKDEVNAFVDANRSSETRQEYKGRKPKEYNEFMLNLFDRLKVQAKKEGKKLFVSNTNILKERMSEFDKVITIPKDEFKKRFDTRGATYGFEDWKSDIDTTIAKVDKSKVINTTGYLSDLLEGNPKTRRILEVQSDLYQKSRDIKSPDEIIAELQKEGKLKIDCN